MTCSKLALATLTGGLLLLSAPASAQSERATSSGMHLTEHQRDLLRLRIERIMARDRQFRSMLSYGTTDLEEIERLAALPLEEVMAAMSDDTRKLSPEIRQLLVRLQRHNDRENLAELEAIVREYGYPSEERLGMENVGLITVLLHPPVPTEEVESHLHRMSALLLPEVQAGRMAARQYAMFVDNMLAKILRRPQRYGTNQEFDPATRQILPPEIADLEQANAARRAIGMPELQDGEYRLAVIRK